MVEMEKEGMGVGDCVMSFDIRFLLYIRDLSRAIREMPMTDNNYTIVSMLVMSVFATTHRAYF